MKLPDRSIYGLWHSGELHMFHGTNEDAQTVIFCSKLQISSILKYLIEHRVGA